MTDIIERLRAAAKKTYDEVSDPLLEALLTVDRVGKLFGARFRPRWAQAIHDQWKTSIDQGALLKQAADEIETLREKLKT